MLARFSTGVPAAALARLKVKVCQPTTLVVASVSTDLLPSVMSSSFRRTGMPASGDQTRSVIVVAVLLKGMRGKPPLATVTTVDPQ